MIALIQRVIEASVAVDEQVVGAIGPGLLALVGIERGDGESEAERLAERVIGYRVFADAGGKMNLCLKDTGGGLLAVPQFTLVADTNSGTRPSFSSAAAPAESELLFHVFVAKAGERHSPVATGRFAAHMQVSLVNDGPVTFWIQVKPARGAALLG